MTLVCEHCSALFTTSHQQSRFCSRSCFGRWRTAHAGKRLPARADAAGPACSTAGCDRPARKRGMCCTHYNRTYQPGRSHGPTYQDWRVANPEVYQQGNRYRRGKQRAARHGGGAEAVDRNVVGERDCWRCGVCRRKVDKAKPYPDPMSPSLDHVVPLAHGGEHTYANTRIAHLRCNSSRGDRGGNEQLRLLG